MCTLASTAHTARQRNGLPAAAGKARRARSAATPLPHLHDGAAGVALPQAHRQRVVRPLHLLVPGTGRAGGQAVHLARAAAVAVRMGRQRGRGAGWAHALSPCAAGVVFLEQIRGVRAQRCLAWSPVTRHRPLGLWGCVVVVRRRGGGPGGGRGWALDLSPARASRSLPANHPCTLLLCPRTTRPRPLRPARPVCPFPVAARPPPFPRRCRATAPTHPLMASSFMSTLPVSRRRIWPLANSAAPLLGRTASGQQLVRRVGHAQREKRPWCWPLQLL